MVLHRTRHLFVRQLTAVVNATRAHMAEFGIVAPKGRKGVAEFIAVIKDLKDGRLPAKTLRHAHGPSSESLQ